MRFSLGQVGDVEVDPGATLAECRTALDALLGPSAGAELSVRGQVLEPEQVAGLPPWLPGSHVDVGPVAWASCAHDAEAAADAPWHLAVAAGPDAGAVAAPGPDGRLTVGRGPGVTGPDGARLALHDPAVSREHVVLASARRGLTVRDLGSANRTWRRRAGRRRLGRPWRPVRRLGRLRVGDRIRLGDTELAVRDDAAVTTGPGSDGGAAGGPTAGLGPRDAREVGSERGRGGARDGPGAEPGARAGRLASLVAPLVVAGVMAALLHTPVFLLMAAVGPLVAVVPAVSARLTRRKAPTPPGPDLGPDAAALTVLLARGCAQVAPWWPLAREGLAVVADDGARAAVGRVVVCGALLEPAVSLTLLPAADAAAGWDWARWLAPRLGGEPGARVPGAGAAALAAPAGPHLVVADGPGPWRTDLDRWWLTGSTSATQERTDRAAVVLLAPDAARPAWCRWVLTVADGRARLRGPGVDRAVAAPAASAAWAEAFARRLAARDAGMQRPDADGGGGGAAGAAGAGGGLPDRARPADVGLPCDLDAVLESWGGRAAGRRALPGLRVPIGLAAGAQGVRAAWLDLLNDGPHALVAGTTGAGKSELLQALVLGLALRYPPAELGLVLLDFKGGAGLLTCAGLPHVVGQVSDLDPEQAVRALEALTAELRRREALLAAAGASDLEALRGSPTGAPPRLLVVVDEFRALAEDLPDFVPALVRLAAQGRSLGMHLVLATQRPAGAVTAQMRANLALRVCLRVTEPAESRDVVDVPDAADLPARTPGRAVVRRADRAPQVVQTTWVALPARRRPPVRPARPWASFGTRTPEEEPTGPGGAASLAALVTAAAGRLGLRPAAPLWTPPLPEVVGARELADVARDAPSGTSADAGRDDAADAGRDDAADAGRDDVADAGRDGVADLAPPRDLVLGLTDPPGAGARGLLTWDGRGLLLVAGAAGSGRTTAAARAGLAALADGRHVHAVGPVGSLLPADHPGLGTVVDHDPRRLARLLTLLADGATGRHPTGGPTAVLLVDDVAAVTAALDRMPRGLGSDLLERLARDATRCGVGLLATGHPRDVARLAPLASARLVLPVADPADDGLLGVPRDLSGRSRPGRGVLVAGGAALRCHVAMPDPRGTADARGATTASAGRASGHPPLRLRPVPEHVARAPATPPGPGPTSPGPTSPDPTWTVTIGAGGDDAGAVAVDARRGVLVVGPGGSGRSSTLATLVLGLAEAGLRVAVVAREGALAGVAGVAGIDHLTTTEAARLPTAPTTGQPFDVLAVDDVDVVARSAPDLDDGLAAWVHATERGEPGPVVLASCRTDRAAAAYRGAIAALRGSAPTMVLSPGEPGSAEAAGAEVAAACDPALPRHPGRGALVVLGRVLPLQVAQPG